MYVLHIKEWERERFLGQKQLKPTKTDICDALSLQRQRRRVFCSFEEEEEEGKRRRGARTTGPRGEEAEEG